MSQRVWSLALLSLLMIGVAVGQGEDSSSAVPAPEVAGEWYGTWGPFNPAQSNEVDTSQCKALECRVLKTSNGWEATFEGECGRPYKYTITMDGRQSGSAVLFRGTTDLGQQDGGIHDWVGRATDKEFIGFYTSQHHTGVFSLSRQ